MDCRLYIFDRIDSFTDSDLQRALDIVSPERRLKTMAYIPMLPRKLSAIAGLTLLFAVKDSLSPQGTPPISDETLGGGWRFTEGHHGKPSFVSPEMPQFNLSHCNQAVACAVASAPVGVDVEGYDSYDEEVAREVFNDTELKSALGHPRRFAELWTIKESLLKFTGEGITDHLRSLLNGATTQSFKTFHNSQRGYSCSVCSDGVLTALEPQFLSKSQLFNVFTPRKIHANNPHQ